MRRNGSKLVRRVSVIVTLVSLVLLAVGSANPAGAIAHYEQSRTLPVGSMVGTDATAGGETLTIDASTLNGHLGSAKYAVGTKVVTITFNCVATYAWVAVTLFPYPGAVGYASGRGNDGKTYYVLANEGNGFSVSTTPGPDVGYNSCGTGYVIPNFGVAGILIVGQQNLDYVNV